MQLGLRNRKTGAAKGGNNPYRPPIRRAISVARKADESKPKRGRTNLLVVPLWQHPQLFPHHQLLQLRPLLLRLEQKIRCYCCIYYSLRRNNVEYLS